MPQSSVNNMNPSQRLIQNQGYSHGQQQLSSLGQAAAPSAFRNQYSQQALSYNNASVHGSVKGNNGPVISTHNRHGLIEIGRRGGAGGGSAAHAGASLW